MKKVILADDNYIVSEGIKMNVDWNRLEAEVVFTAQNGQEVLEYMKVNGVDLIITDIEMPNIDGITLSCEAMKLNPHVKIILISAYDKFEYAKQAVRLGVCDYIEKPIDYIFLCEKIKNAFDAIDREQRNLSILKESRQLMVTKFFQDLLYYSPEKLSENFEKYIEYLELKTDYSNFNIIKLEIESDSLLGESDGVLTYQMEILNLSDIFMTKCEVFDSVHCIQDLNNLIFIIAQNSRTPAHFQYVIHKVVSAFMDSCRNSVLNVSIGIGTVVDSLWKLHVSYENACHALKYRFFYPHKNIFDALEATGKEFSLLSFSDSSEEELISLLCKKDSEAIKDWLEKFFKNLSMKYENKNLMFIRIYSLLGKILKFLYEINIDTSDLEEKIISAYSHFETFHTYEQFFLWMNELCALVCNKLNVSLKSYHDQTCELVDNYIKSNFEDNTLSLNDIAKFANMSPSYLSALYKKNVGQGITDTIMGYRIEAAKGYLEKTTLSLKEISIKCGYTNQYYFSTSFKKQLGISPSEYRDKHSKL